MCLNVDVNYAIDIAVSMERLRIPISWRSSTLGIDVWNRNDVDGVEETFAWTFSGRTHDNTARYTFYLYVVKISVWCKSSCFLELKTLNWRRSIERRGVYTSGIYLLSDHHTNLFSHTWRLQYTRLFATAVISLDYCFLMSFWILTVLSYAGYKVYIWTITVPLTKSLTYIMLLGSQSTWHVIFGTCTMKFKVQCVT